MINLLAPFETKHVGDHAIDDYSSDFVARLVWLQEKSGGELTERMVRQLAPLYGLLPMKADWPDRPRDIIKMAGSSSPEMIILPAPEAGSADRTIPSRTDAVTGSPVGRPVNFEPEED